MRDFKVVRRFFCIIAALVIMFTGVVSVQAATINVTANAADVLNGANGSCALREAIKNMNDGADTYADCANTGAAYGTSNTINLPAGTYTNAIAGANELSNATGSLDILQNVTISGAGAGSSIIDGGAIDRVFYVDAGVTVSIPGVTIQNGSNTNGAAFLTSGSLTITNSAISGNSAGSIGGGIYNNNGTLIITNSTISGNSAGSIGGGIYSNSTVTITNSTISGNSAVTSGGGIYNNNGTFTITNSTVSGNTNQGIRNANGTTTLSNTIVANQTAGSDCSIVGGAINSNGYNLDSNNSCNLVAGTDIPGSAANLGALANNGGTTNTMALQAGSAAIDAGSCVNGTDQRGYIRPAGATCDIGAYEYPAYTVTPSAGAGGAIAPNTQQTINYGSTTAFTVTPNAGYSISSTGGTCGGTLVGTTYTTNAITANCMVTASFTLNTYTVTPSAGAGGTIAPNTPQTINHGSTTAFTVTPNAGYSISSTGGTCGGALVGNTYTTNVITANCTVTASFTLDTPPCSYSISPSSRSFDISGGTGTVSVTSGCAWTAASNASWASITSGSSGSGNGTVGFTVPANSGASRTGSLTIAGHSFTITQAGVQYSLVVTKSGTGIGSIKELPGPNLFFGMFSRLLCGTDCQVALLNYDIGTQVNLYSEPQSGTTFIGWSGGGCSGTGVCTVTVNENTSINAAFAPVSTPATDKATTTLETIGNDIYVKTPIIKYLNTSNSTTTYYSVEFVYLPANDNKVWLKLTKVDLMTDIAQYSGAQLSQLYQVESDWRLHLTTIEYNGASVWADLEYTPTNDGDLWFVVTGSGEN